LNIAPERETCEVGILARTFYLGRDKVSTRIKAKAQFAERSSILRSSTKPICQCDAEKESGFRNAIAGNKRWFAVLRPMQGDPERKTAENACTALRRARFFFTS